MTLSAGSRLGPYEIVSRIGAGGMGEVWRAKDTRLERNVAIKVLPSDFATNAQLRVRFDREARTISRLNHPNICTIHDVGHDGGVDYLVLELLEGETLADRLARGPLPLSEVVRYGVQISEALDRAHRAGIVHRDLKPGNVMLTRGGAKLLDFGLAKIASVMTPEGAGDGIDAPTAAKPLTAQGTIVGTFQYMSPEQLEGVELDHRSDIFSLGALLYEMTTGRRAFDGKTKTSLIAAIVGAAPPRISTFQPLTPPSLEHLIAKCLEKDRDDRWQSAHDIAEALKWIGEAGSQAGMSPAVTSRGRFWQRSFAGVAVLALVAVVVAGTAVARLSRELASAKRPLHLEVSPPRGHDFILPRYATAPISPDGQRLAFVTLKDNTFRLYVRELTSGQTRLILTASSGFLFPFWSPQSDSIGFFNEGKLKRISADGGAAQTVAAAPGGRGGSWNIDDVIVFAPDIRGPLVRVPAAGGTAVPVSKPRDSQWTNRNPSFLPDGRHFLYVERHVERGASGSLMVGSLDGGTPKMLVEQASNAQYARGHIFYVSDSNLVAQEFDLEELEVRGAPVPLAENIDYENARDMGNFSVSESTLVYRPSMMSASRLVRISRDGQETPVLNDAGYFRTIFFSRDGRKAGTYRSDEAGRAEDVWVLDLERGQLTRATFTATSGILSAALSADGERLVVGAQGGQTTLEQQLWIQPVSGTSGGRKIDVSGLFVVADWSADGRYVLGGRQEPGTQTDIAYIDLLDKDTLTLLVAGPAHENQPRFSPDGRWVAYHSDESGRMEVYVTDFPEATRKWQVSKAGGMNPQWSSGGREIWYLHADTIHVATVASSGDGLTLGEAKTLLKLDRGTTLAPSPDGTFAIAERPVDPEHPEPLHVVRNWNVRPQIRTR